MQLETPYPYQLIGADYLADHPQAFLADDMGLGKSCHAQGNRRAREARAFRHAAGAVPSLSTRGNLPPSS